MVHIVALSGGKDSTALALRLRDIEPGSCFDFVCTPTGNELPEMLCHWEKLSELLGQPLNVLTGGSSLQGLIRRQRALPNHRMRWCTRMIKIEPFQAYLLNNSPAVVSVGIRADELGREGVDHNAIGGITMRYPLVEWGWGLGRVVGYLAERGVEVPSRTDCAMCFYQTLGEWWHLWKDNRTDYREAEKYERWLGHTLRSEQRDTWPASLRGLRKEFERGKVPVGTRLQGELFTGMGGRKTMCAVCAR